MHHTNHQRMRKAAILVTSLDHPSAERIREGLSPVDTAALERAIGRLGRVDPEERSDVLDEFRFSAAAAAKARPLGVRSTPWGTGEEICRRRQRRLVVGLGQEPLLGSRRPPPGEIRSRAGNALGPHERPNSAREQDGDDHRRAPRPVSEAAGGHRPDDEGHPDGQVG